MKKILFVVLLAATLISAAVLPAAASEAIGGELIYEQKFDMPDEPDQAALLAQLNWTVQTKAMGAYTDPTAQLSVSEGRLQVVGSKDTYYLMLTEEQMAPYDGKTITIQYDMEYTTAGDVSRYFCILANYAGQRYNSFHFRNSGTANNQAHFDGAWVTYDAYNATTDAYAAANDSNNGSSIAMKLLGMKFVSGQTRFSGVPVTVRYVLDPDAGISVHMKLAEQDEGAFVLVSVQDPAADGNSYYRTWNANAICLKIGGSQNGFIDNIAVWTGNGNYPQPVEETTEAVTESAEEPTEPEQPTEETPETENETEKKPEKVREPQTIVNKIAIWAVALFGGFIILKKGKEENQDK